MISLHIRYFHLCIKCNFLVLHFAGDAPWKIEINQMGMNPPSSQQKDLWCKIDLLSSNQFIFRFGISARKKTQLFWTIIQFKFLNLCDIVVLLIEIII